MVNPFSTRFWVSGVLPFQFAEHGETIDSLLEKSQRYSICQIVGPHGSGKSTLLLQLLKRYEESGESVRLLLFNDQHRCLPDDLMFSKNQILFADGFEQLPLLRQFWLRVRSKRLILTCHRAVRFVPILYRTQPQFSVFVQIVRQIVSDALDESALQVVYERSGGNFRTAFFELYDQWEKRNTNDGR